MLQIQLFTAKKKLFIFLLGRYLAKVRKPFPVTYKRNLIKLMKL